jgi:hypothetical protein
LVKNYLNNFSGNVILILFGGTLRGFFLGALAQPGAWTWGLRQLVAAEERIYCVNDDHIGGFYIARF